MRKQKKPFATVMQAVLVVLLVVSLLLIAQQFSMKIYQLGLMLLGASAITQIGFGNIPPNSNFTQSMKYLILSYIIVGAMFGLGIILTPTLIGLARG